MHAIFRAFCVAIILTIPIVARAQGNIIPPSGDTTGKTDGAAINAALSSNLSAELACKAQYYTDVTIQVPAGTALTLSSGGTGYTLTSVVPVIYNSPLKVTIINPFCEDGVTGASPCWPWIVRSSGGTEGIRIQGDTAIIDGVSVPADLEPTGIGNQHYLKYLDSSGATHLISVVPQVYP